MEIRLVLMRDGKGGYAVYIPSLIGCVREGDTIEEALRNLREAVGRYFGSAAEG